MDLIIVNRISFKLQIRELNMNAKIILNILLWSALLSLPGSTWAEGLTGYSPNQALDMLPPQITVISPLPDSVIESEAPLIEILFEDPGSDIDPNTIRLLLDRMDITGPAVVERLDSPGQAAAGPYRISYQTTASLKQGIHELYFSVRDKAGNLAERNWTFQVQLSIDWGIRTGGSATLQYNIIPVYSAAEILDLTVQGQYEDTDVQLHLFGRLLDHYEGISTFNYENYNFYLDSYSLGIYHQRFGLVLGCAGVSLESELFQNSPEKGWVAGDTIETAAGQFNWSLFSGKTANSSGLDMRINDINGAIGKWSSLAGWSLGGFCLRLDGEDGRADFIDIKGNSPYGKPVLFRYELIHGKSGDDGAGQGQAGNAVAVHLDKYIGASVFGVDYLLFEEDYPALSVNSLCSLSDGGVHRYTIRSYTPFAGGQSLSVDGSFSADNLDGSSAVTTRQENLNVGYVWSPGPAFNFIANYQWNDLHSISNESERKITNNLLLDLTKNFRSSTLHTSLTLGHAHDPGSGESSDQRSFSGAWTWPAGKYNLIPSANWTVQNQMDGSIYEGGDFRVMVDGRLQPGASRSSLAVYRTVDADARTMVFKASTGVTVNAFLKVWENSNLTFTYDCNWWLQEDNLVGHSEGWDQNCSIIWKYLF